MGVDTTSITHTDTNPEVWRTADSFEQSDSRRGTMRREKSSQTARGAGQGARQTSSRHPIDLRDARSIIPTGPVARARSRAAVRASAGLRQTLNVLKTFGKGKGLKVSNPVPYTRSTSRLRAVTCIPVQRHRPIKWTSLAPRLARSVRLAS